MFPRIPYLGVTYPVRWNLLSQKHGSKSPPPSSPIIDPSDIVEQIESNLPEGATMDVSEDKKTISVHYRKEKETVELGVDALLYGRPDSALKSHRRELPDTSLDHLSTSSVAGSLPEQHPVVTDDGKRKKEEVHEEGGFWSLFKPLVSLFTSDPEPTEQSKGHGSSQKAPSLTAPTIKEESKEVKSVRATLKNIENGIGGLELGFSAEISEMLNNMGIDEEKRLEFMRTKQRMELSKQLRAVEGEIAGLEEDERVKEELSLKRRFLVNKIKQARQIPHVPPVLSGDEMPKVTADEIRMKLKEVSGKLEILGDPFSLEKFLPGNDIESVHGMLQQILFEINTISDIGERQELLGNWSLRQGTLRTLREAASSSLVTKDRGAIVDPQLTTRRQPSVPSGWNHFGSSYYEPPMRHPLGNEFTGRQTVDASRSTLTGHVPKGVEASMRGTWNVARVVGRGMRGGPPALKVVAGVGPLAGATAYKLFQQFDKGSPNPKKEA
jgi:hypothetical protein